MKKKSTFLCALALLIFSACTKDNQQQLNDVPTYSSMEELHQMLSGENLSTQSKSKSDGQNYKLYIDEVERMYRAIDTNLFRNMDQLKAYVKNNSSWLELTQDENGEYTLLPKYLNHPYSSAMNMDRLFYVGNTLYKVYEEGLVSAESPEAQKSLIDHNIFPDKIEQLVVSVDFVSAKPQLYPCETSIGQIEISDQVDNGRNRISYEIKSFLYKHTNKLEYAAIYFKIRPFKRTLGIWYWCNRTISADLNLAIEVIYPYKKCATLALMESFAPEMRSVLEKTWINMETPALGGVFRSSKSWVKTPDFHTPVYITF